MKTSRSTADRVRPIIQAMERSIESARRRRMHDTDDQPRPRPVPIEHTTHGDGEIPRRKARPKRTTPELRRYDGEYRAEAV